MVGVIFSTSFGCPSCVSGMTSEVRLSGRVSNVLYGQCGGRLCDNATSLDGVHRYGKYILDSEY